MGVKKDSDETKAMVARAKPSTQLALPSLPPPMGSREAIRELMVTPKLAKLRNGHLETF